MHLVINQSIVQIKVLSHYYTRGKVEGSLKSRLKHKVSLYTDDLLLFVSKPATSLSEALTVLDLFSQFSGYKLNLNKSELFPIRKLLN